MTVLERWFEARKAAIGYAQWALESLVFILGSMLLTFIQEGTSRIINRTLAPKSFRRRFVNTFVPVRPCPRFSWFLPLLSCHIGDILEAWRLLGRIESTFMAMVLAIINKGAFERWRSEHRGRIVVNEGDVSDVEESSDTEQGDHVEARRAPSFTLSRQSRKNQTKRPRKQSSEQPDDRERGRTRLEGGDSDGVEMFLSSDDQDEQFPKISSQPKIKELRRRRPTERRAMTDQGGEGTRGFKSRANDLLYSVDENGPLSDKVFTYEKLNTGFFEDIKISYVFYII